MKIDRLIPFKIEIAAEFLNDLQFRLKNTRWSGQVDGTNWETGTDLNYLKELVACWRGTYDWRKQETALNQFAHFKTEVDDIGIHFIHERGKGRNPFPLILRHGYPDSFYRFAKIIPMLTDPVHSVGGRKTISMSQSPTCRATDFPTALLRSERFFGLGIFGRT
jgi:hypothetical protein